MKHFREICFILLLALTGLEAGGAEAKRVMFIHSFGWGFEPVHTGTELLRTELASQWGAPIEFFDVSLESTRVADLEQEGPLLNYLKAQFARRHFDLVVVIGGPAARFAQQRRQELFPETPVLRAVDTRFYNRADLTTKDTSALMSNDPALTVKTMLQVLPETTNVVVVMGNSAHERFWSADLRPQLQQYTNRVSFVWLDQLPFSEMLERCATLPPRSAILFVLLCVDAAGVPHQEERVLLKLHETANAPIFGIWRNQLGQGILGGRLMDSESYGRNAANAAARILRGENPGMIIPPQRVGPPEFDWREMKRWGIREAQLPADSVVRFRQPGIWQRYWWPVCGGLLLVAVEAALIVGLLVNRAKRRRGEAVATLIAELSSRFINLPGDQVDPEIQAAQQRVCDALGLDISTLWQWRPDNPMMHTLTHLYRPLGGPPVPQTMKGQDYFPWCQRQVLAGKVVTVSSLADLPAEAVRDREVFSHYGVKTNLTIPLSVGGGPVFGSVNFNDTRKERRWSGALVQQLHLVAQIFANALARKRSSEALRQSEEQYRHLFEQMHSGVIVLEVILDHAGNPVDHRLVQANAEFEVQTGLKRSEQLGKTSAELSFQWPEEVRQRYYQVALGGKPFQWERFNEGLKRFYDVRVFSPCRGQFAVLFHDITEHKRAEAEAQRVRLELAHVSRVSTLGELAASLAHELSQPLGAILRNAEAAELILQEPAPDLEELRAAVGDILKDDQRAGHVIDRLRSLLKRGSLELKPIDLNAVITEVLSLVASDASTRRVKITYSAAPGLPTVQGDRVHLQQVVLNLLVNAMDAMDEIDPKKRSIRIIVQPADGGMVIVRVCDSGPGIFPESLGKLFEPFFTTKAKGMGMGLPVSQTIIHSHKGKLWAENQPEGGACFCFTLPVIAAGGAA